MVAVVVVAVVVFPVVWWFFPVFSVFLGFFAFSRVFACFRVFGSVLTWPDVYHSVPPGSAPHYPSTHYPPPGTHAATWSSRLPTAGWFARLLLNSNAIEDTSAGLAKSLIMTNL